MSNAFHLALAFEQLSFSYGNNPVLSDVTLSLPRGEVMALMGPSGSGKTTVLALAAGLLKPTTGRVLRTCRSSAMVFQDPRLLPWHTALDNVGFALKAKGLPAKERGLRARAALNSVGLSQEDAHKYPHQLSGGMQQRTSLARALVIEPDFLLLDEPFSALDNDLAQQMQHLVSNYIHKHQATALLVTHTPRDTQALATQTAYLSMVSGCVVSIEAGLAM